MTENLPSPFMKVERNEWKTLREREKINITEEETVGSYYIYIGLRGPSGN